MITNKLLTIFPALSYRNYQLYFGGQLISFTGNWLQIVAQGWLVLQLTTSPFLIGLVAALSTLPFLAFSLFGGVIVDRFPKQKILFFTQLTAMVLALILGSLTLLNLINIWAVALLAFLLGTVNAIDAPARQAFTVTMVDKKHLASAISLNAGIFNGARAIGPSIAGFLISLIGSGGAFILNGLGYIASISAIKKINVEEITHDSHPHPLRAIQEGVKYTITHPILRTLMLFAGITSVFGWSYVTIMPIIAKQTFGVDATGLGYLYTASGLGALTATIIVSAFSQKIKPVVFIFGGNTIFTISMILFSLTSSLTLALPLLFLSGTGLLCQFAITNSTIQHLVEDRYRGRVMSIYTLVFLGLSPLGSLQIGFISEHFGTGFAMRAGVIVTYIAALIILLNYGKIIQSYRAYKEKNSALII